MSDHKTKNIVIKKAEIDEGILPLVKFINSFAGIETMFSCQGEYEKQVCEHCLSDIKSNSYVMFRARYMRDIVPLIHRISPLTNGFMELGYDPFGGFHITIRFRSRYHLDEVMNYLGLTDNKKESIVIDDIECF